MSDQPSIIIVEVLGYGGAQAGDEEERIVSFWSRRRRWANLRCKVRARADSHITIIKAAFKWRLGSAPMPALIAGIGCGSHSPSESPRWVAPGDVEPVAWWRANFQWRSGRSWTCIGRFSCEQRGLSLSFAAGEAPRHLQRPRPDGKCLAEKTGWHAACHSSSEGPCRRRLRRCSLAGGCRRRRPKRS